MFYGIPGIAFVLLKIYFQHRCQYVNINCNCSEIKPIFSSVPQGSILEPLLFNLYVNDHPIIKKNAIFIIYADDTSIFLSAKECDVAIEAAKVPLPLVPG